MFRNAEGWEWLDSPDLERNLGTRGSRGGKCMMMYENREENAVVMVHLALDAELISRECRPVGFDAEGRRYDFKSVGSVSSNTQGLLGFELPFGDLESSLLHLGVEARSEGFPSTAAFD